MTLHLDTCAYSAYMRGLEDAVAIVDRAPSIAISPIVIGELKAGFALGTKEARNRAQLQVVLDSPRVAVGSMDDGVTDAYAAILKRLRRKGSPIPTNDLWIAAAALSEGGALLTFDEHFRLVDGLRVVSTYSEWERTIGR